MIANKYQIIKQIGSGNFGSIYQGENIITREPVAIKLESVHNGTKLLKNETKIYHYLHLHTDKKIIGIPKVKSFGLHDEYYYMILNLLGPSLQTIKEKKGIFSLPTILQIGIQLIKRLQYIHEKGLIHRDVKPDNFLLGLGDKKHVIYMIDFGFCKKYQKNEMNNKLIESNESNE